MLLYNTSGEVPLHQSFAVVVAFVFGYCFALSRLLSPPADFIGLQRKNFFYLELKNRIEEFLILGV